MVVLSGCSVFRALCFTRESAQPTQRTRFPAYVCTSFSFPIVTSPSATKESRLHGSYPIHLPHTPHTAPHKITTCHPHTEHTSSFSVPSHMKTKREGSLFAAQEGDGGRGPGDPAQHVRRPGPPLRWRWRRWWRWRCAEPFSCYTPPHP
jgi:hypothetical protein